MTARHRVGSVPHHPALHVNPAGGTGAANRSGVRVICVSSIQDRHRARSDIVAALSAAGKRAPERSIDHPTSHRGLMLLDGAGDMDRRNRRRDQHLLTRNFDGALVEAGWNTARRQREISCLGLWGRTWDGGRSAELSWFNINPTKGNFPRNIPTPQALGLRRSAAEAPRYRERSHRRALADMPDRATRGRSFPTGLSSNTGPIAPIATPSGAPAPLGLRPDRLWSADAGSAGTLDWASSTIGKQGHHGTRMYASRTQSR